MADKETSSLAAFLYEMGHLKRSKRQGWWIAGVKDPESVAEHSFRTAIIGYVLAVMEGANPERTAAMCLFHDSQETRIGDIPSTGRPYLTMASAEEITKDQVAEMPSVVGQGIRDLVAEYEARESIEARLAKDADKLECLIQAREYQAQGYADVPPWVDTMLAALKSESARALADAALATSPREWWYDVVSNYGVNHIGQQEQPRDSG